MFLAGALIDASTILLDARHPSPHAGPNIRIPVTSGKEAFQLINRGNKHRAVGSTQCNDSSSRSHAVLTLHVESRAVTAGSAAADTSPELRLGKMHLVDLAGNALPPLPTRWGFQSSRTAIPR